MASSQVVNKRASRAARSGGALLAATLCAVALGGCMSVKSERVNLVPVAASEPVGSIQLSRAVVAVLPNETVVTLASGSQWQRTGAILQGDVYRSQGGLFTITTRRQNEAYLVASSGKLVGFYLPGESSFMALSRPVNLPVEMRQ
ncbi:hypothetical protein LMG3458_05702 [Achromobacter deleyi]|uniref:Uncharacterized protein n=1 Tax=Achromobacter deleyi TaxID=1353891 RepID=A0A6S7ARZ7_9BURK|nr:hypothetical protein [Achromobacter deleyi]CAB3740241.1 hypothetical protein LMG3458_05702 [Achromobacter deleyi]CAB3901869.1 hypothetical protein LMG3412_04289 [Achromobacter deleyi]CAB3903188.1 hypothetical protein LMG3481_04381 [Achromobacter deleyi]CAB3910969.1 hypothetical protein LMG3482_04818 [Achromobacter deleyi]